MKFLATEPVRLRKDVDVKNQRFVYSGQVLTKINDRHPNYMKVKTDDTDEVGYVHKSFIVPLSKKPGTEPLFVTLKQFRGTFGNTKSPDLGEIVDALNEFLPQYGIMNTGQRLSHFLSQCALESDRFMRLEENLHYTTQNILDTFGAHFDHDEQEAKKYAGNPEKLANKVYADKIGNGPESSGDGYRFRGRGLIQLTGRKNYRLVGKAIGLDLEAEPDLLADPHVAVKSACGYWKINHLNKIADKNNLWDLTYRINTARKHLERRVGLYRLARNEWGGKPVDDKGLSRERGNLLKSVATGGSGVGLTGTAVSDLDRDDESGPTSNSATAAGDKAAAPEDTALDISSESQELEATMTPSPQVDQTDVVKDDSTEMDASSTKTAESLDEAASVDDTEPQGEGNKMQKYVLEIGTEYLPEQIQGPLATAARAGNGTESIQALIGVVFFIVAVRIFLRRWSEA